MKNIIAVLVFMFATVVLTQAQPRGTMFGRVVLERIDGTPVSEAHVQVRNLATGEIQEALTDDLGRWRVPNLASGNYAIRFTRADLETATAALAFVVAGDPDSPDNVPVVLGGEK